MIILSIIRIALNRRSMLAAFIWLTALTVAPVSTAADESQASAAPGLGKVLFVRRDGPGLLAHAERGDILLEFPSPGCVRISDGKTQAPDAIPTLWNNRSGGAASFEILDSRFSVVQTGALQVEIQREPFRLVIRDLDGGLVLGGEASRGLGPFGAETWEWQTDFLAAGGVRGFGLRRSETPLASNPVLFNSDLDEADSNAGDWLSAQPCGRLGERCGLLLNVSGGARLEFPWPGRMRFVNGGPLEAFVFRARTDEEFRSGIREIVGPSPAAPPWLLGMGFRADEFQSYREIRELALDLSGADRPVDWMLFPAKRVDREGWNDPLGALKPNFRLWPNLREGIELLMGMNVAPVFEAPSLFDKEISPLPSIDPAIPTESPAEIQVRPSAASAASAAYSDFPFDYTAPDGLERWQAISRQIEGAGMTSWMFSEQCLPAQTWLEANGLKPGAAWQRIRARHWRKWLGPQMDSGANSVFLSPDATAESERFGQFLSPWRVDPRRHQPSEVFESAMSAYESGLTIWGIELPVDPAAYPSIQSYRRWLQAAVFAPSVLFRSQSAARALPDLPIEVFQEMERFWKARTRLRPYVYSLAYESHLTGAPICRPTEDATGNLGGARPGNASFLCGPRLLVAAMDDQDPGYARVRFPEGEWIGLDDGRAWPGGGTVDVQVGPGGIAAFVLRGCVIPFFGALENSSASYPVARIYPSSGGEYRFYEPAAAWAGAPRTEIMETRFAWEFDSVKEVLSLVLDGPVGGVGISRGEMLLQVYSIHPPRAVSIDGEMAARRRFVNGGSRLLEKEAPLNLQLEMLPQTAAWDHDGSGFLYVWLPARKKVSTVDVYAARSVLPSDSPGL